jgi:hypothetical protein
MMIEFIDYRRIHVEPSIEVDRSRGEKLVIDVDVTFPRIPCYCKRFATHVSSASEAHTSVLSLDVMDISGEQQHDVTHEITKTRVSKEGYELETLRNGRTCISLQELLGHSG